MSDVYLVPMEKPHHNFTLKGYPSEAGRDGSVSDLSSYREDGWIDSTWHMPSLWQRLRFLWSGEITLRVLSKDSSPPVAIAIGDIYERAYAAHVKKQEI